MKICPQCGAGAYTVTEYVHDRWTGKWKRDIAWQCVKHEHHNNRRGRAA